MASALANPIVTLAVGGVELLISIIVLGISGSLIADYAGSPSQFNFNLFTALWTILVVAYILLTVRLSNLGHPAGHLGLYFVTWVFWLAAFACCAHILNAYDVVYEVGKVRALVAFGVIEWVLFTFSLIAAVLGFLDWRRGGSRAKGGQTSGV